MQALNLTDILQILRVCSCEKFQTSISNETAEMHTATAADKRAADAGRCTHAVDTHAASATKAVDMYAAAAFHITCY